VKRLLATLIAASVSLEIDIEHTLESCLAKLETADEIEGRGAGAILGSRPLNDPATNPSFPPRPVRLHLGRSGMC